MFLRGRSICFGISWHFLLPYSTTICIFFRTILRSLVGIVRAI